MEKAIVLNNELIDLFSYLKITYPNSLLVIEDVKSYGMPVGESIFTTVKWIGRFTERWGADKTIYITRRKVKMHLCNSMRAKDTNIRQALIDRFGDVGTKKNPGVLYGIKSHLWSALAVVVTYYDMKTC